jgi:hypothetical protein
MNRSAGQIALPLVEEIAQACSGKADRDIDREHSDPEAHRWAASPTEAGVPPCRSLLI